MIGTHTDITALKETEAQLQQHILELDLIYRCTNIVSEALNFDDALKNCLSQICDSMKWDMGHVYRLNHEGTELVSAGIWNVLNSKDAQKIKKLSQRTTFKKGLGLPGAIWAAGEPLWVEDINQGNTHLYFTHCKGHKFHSAIGIPIMAYGKLVAICEFFSYKIAHKNEKLLRLLQALGEQIGRGLEHKKIELQLETLAHFDTVTLLPNRAYFQEVLERAISKGKRTNNALALLYFDLDNFKKVNDFLGHSVGDKLLKEVARSIKKETRSSDFIARFGGDEFVVLIEDIDSSIQAARLAERIIARFQSPFMIDEHEVNTSVSIGIAICSVASDDMNSLMKHADMAMYQAKELGKNMHQFFSEELNKEYVKRTLIESHLRHAIENNELSVVYQPQVSLVSDRVYGFEALVRWNSPQLGQVPPLDFIGIAEEVGLIADIGDWVLEEACQQFKVWEKAQGAALNHVNMMLSINLSVMQLASNHIVLKLAELIERYNLNPNQLILEVTETTLMLNLNTSMKTLNQLHKLGVGIAIDDFGTGYSSLNYLKHLPFTALKIDKSFVKDVIEDANDAAIVKAIIQLGCVMNLDIIAEGIETKQQLDFLKEIGCHYGQGYLLSYPLSSEDALTFIKNNNSK
jgi:diguanylate cyclase (GGDEF)-like protein